MKKIISVLLSFVLVISVCFGFSTNAIAKTYDIGVDGYWTLYEYDFTSYEDLFILRFVPEVSMPYQFRTYGDCDTVAYLYDSSYNIIDYNDDISANDRNSLVEGCLTAGKTYYIGVGYALYNGYPLDLGYNNYGEFDVHAYYVYDAIIEDMGVAYGSYTSKKYTSCMFMFEPYYTDNYTFYSSGLTAKATVYLRDSSEAYNTHLVKVASGSTVDGKGFCVTAKLTKGQTYFLVINANGSYGSFKVTGIKNHTHSYTKTVTKAPTSKATGTLTSVCKKCKYKKTTTLSKIPTVSISSITAKSKGFTVKWNKKSSATGYQIHYSTSSKFSNPKSVTISKNSTVSKSVVSLKAKKKYYVRIRTYKTIEGKKYYSAWSASKTVTTKK